MKCIISYYLMVVIYINLNILNIFSCQSQFQYTIKFDRYIQGDIYPIIRQVDNTIILNSKQVTIINNLQQKINIDYEE